MTGESPSDPQTQSDREGMEDGRSEMKHKETKTRHRQGHTNPKKIDIERQERRAMSIET